MIEIEAVVRKWLSDRMERFARYGIVPDSDTDAVARIAELEGYREDVKADLKIGGQSPSMTTNWIVQAIKEERGWQFDERSAAHRNLRRVVVRGQLEATSREEQDLQGAPRVIEDATFAPEEYRLDNEQGRAKPKRSVALRSLFDGYVGERNPAPATVKAWKRQLDAFIAYLGHEDASLVSTANVVAWKEHLLSGAHAGGDRLPPRRSKALICRS